MIKLFEPFRPKIKLHIRQDFLQDLWDKYVPVSSESYENISLIYLKGGSGESEKGAKQVQLLVDLVLKNLFMQIHISQNPILITQNGVSTSLQYTLKYYLAQLKRTDLWTFQSLNRYITYLKQAAEENTRFEFWKRDSQVLVRMEQEYRTLQHFSERLRDLSTVQSAEIEKSFGNELLRSMKKSEYRFLAKSMVWQDRKQIEEWIRSSSRTAYRQMVERLVKEPSLYSLIVQRDEKIQENKSVSETEISREFLIEQIEKHFEKDEFWKFYHKVLFPEKSVRSEEAVLFSEKHIGSEEEILLPKEDKQGEEALLSEKLILSDETVPLSESTVIWEKSRKKMIYHLNRLSGEKIHAFWEQIRGHIVEIYKQQETELLKEKYEKQEAELLKEKYGQQTTELLKEKYGQQEAELLKENLTEQKKEIREQTEVYTLSDKVRSSRGDMDGGMSFEYRSMYIALEEMQKNYVREMSEGLRTIVEETREQDGSELMTHIMNLQSIRKYNKASVSMETTENMIGEPEAPGEVKSAIEKSTVLTEMQDFRNTVNRIQEEVESRLEEQKDRIVEREIEVLNRYQDVLHMKELIRDSLQQEEETEFRAEGKAEKEFLFKYRELPLSETEVQKLWNWSRVLLTNTDSSDTDSSEKDLIINERVNIEERAEFRKLIERLNASEKQQAFHIEYRENRFINEEIHELIRHTHQMDQEQYSLFVRVLSDMIQVRQQAVRERKEESYDQETVEIFRSRYGTSLTEETVRMLQSWSEALLDIREPLYLREDRDSVRQEGSVSTQQEDRGSVRQEDSVSIQQEDGSFVWREDSGFVRQNRTLQEFQNEPELVMREPGEKMTIEERTELRKLIGLLNEYGKQYSFHLEYRETSLSNEKVRELLTYTRQMGQQQYPLLVRALSDMIQARQQAVRGQKEKAVIQDSRHNLPEEVSVMHPETKTENTPISQTKELQYHDVEKIFRSHYRTGLTEEVVRKLYQWGETLHGSPESLQAGSKALMQEHTVYDVREDQGFLLRNIDEKAAIEDRAQFQKIIEQINEYGKQHSVHIEYRESILADKEVQELIRHIRQMDQEQYLLLVRALSDMIHAQQTVREQIERRDAEQAFRSYYGTQLTAEAIQELYHWGETLAANGRTGRQESGELISERREESPDYISGDMQTEIIRQHIQQAKDRSEFHQLIEQVNHYAGDAVRLEYREEQVQNPTIQKLIQHIRQLDEEQHRLFVRQLSKMIEVQQGIREWKNAVSENAESPEENTSPGTQKLLPDQEERLEKRENHLIYQRTRLAVQEKQPVEQRAGLITQGKQPTEQRAELIAQRKQSEEQKTGLKVQGNQLTNQTLRFSHRISQRIYERYPELSRRIQEYEVRRRETYETEIRQLMVNESWDERLLRPLRLNMVHVAAALSEPEQKNAAAGDLVGLEKRNALTSYFINLGEENASIENAARLREAREAEVIPGEPRLLPESRGYENRQELKHAASKEQMQYGRPQQDERMQEERIRMKSAQSQMDARLKQVEQQLKQVESRTNGKEDVRETAEKIKKLLHEELHLEKLRRGLT